MGGEHSQAARMDYKGATSSLEQWVGLAVRAAKASYRSLLKEEERQYFEAGGVKKAGARIRMLERVASTVAVGLSNDFLAEADAVAADALSVQQAQAKVMAFFDYVSREAQALASYLHPGQSALGATHRLVANLRLDFADRTESLLSKRKAQSLRLIGNDYVSHRYDEVLHAVQARHIEIEEQFQAAGRGFDNAGFVAAQVAFANDRVIDFVRDERVKVAVEPARFKPTALQLHSEALARIFMGLRRDEFGELRMLASECTDVFAAKRDEGIRRINGEIGGMILPQISAKGSLQDSPVLTSHRGFDDSEILRKIRADRAAGTFKNNWKACIHYEEEAEGSKEPEARARRLHHKLRVGLEI